MIKAKVKRTHCYWCGNTVPREGAVIRDYNPRTREYTRIPNPRAGMPAVSGSMSGIDPGGLFCTMRCAARYAVRAVERTYR